MLTAAVFFSTHFFPHLRHVNGRYFHDPFTLIPNSCTISINFPSYSCAARPGAHRLLPERGTSTSPTTTRRPTEKKKKIHRDRKDSTTLTCAKSLLACYCSSSVTTAPRFFVAVHNPLEPRETSGATVTTRTLTEYTHGTMVVTKETNHFPTIRSIAFGH